jgi:hypothetical protein
MDHYIEETAYDGSENGGNNVKKSWGDQIQIR